MTRTSFQAFEKHNCCVLIPTFNNAGTLAGVIESVQIFTSRIIIIDDGSTDESNIILQKYTQLKVIHLPENKGKGVALRTGFKEAVAMGYDNAITIDSDGQHFAEDIPLFFQELESNPDALIVGARNMTGESIPGKSSFGYKISNFWFRFETGISLPDTQSGFRLYPVKQLNDLHFFTTRYEFEIEVLVKAAWNGIPVISVPIRVYYAKGKYRVTHFRPLTDFTRVGLLHTWLVLLTFLWYFPQRFFNRLKKKTSGKFSARRFQAGMNHRLLKLPVLD